MGVLPGEEEEEGLQQDEEKGAGRGTEPTSAVSGAASEGAVEGRIEGASPPAEEVTAASPAYALSGNLPRRLVFPTVNSSGDSSSMTFTIVFGARRSRQSALHSGTAPQLAMSCMSSTELRAESTSPSHHSRMEMTPVLST